MAAWIGIWRVATYLPTESSMLDGSMMVIFVSGGSGEHALVEHHRFTVAVAQVDFRRGAMPGFAAGCRMARALPCKVT